MEHLLRKRYVETEFDRLHEGTDGACREVRLASGGRTGGRSERPSGRDPLKGMAWLR